MKICIKCKSTNFYKSGDCRDCAKTRRNLNIEASREKCRIWRLNNKLSVAIYNAEYQKNNKEKIKQLGENWRRNNAALVVAKNAKYYKLNKNKSLESNKEWRETHPEEMRIHHLNRRVKIRTTGKLSKDLFYRLFSLQQGRCISCRVCLIKGNAHMDHITPIAKGGLNVDVNIQLLCQSCNQKKHTKHPIDFMQSMGYLC